MVPTTDPGPSDLEKRIASLSPWHYRFRFPGGVETPVRDSDWNNRHDQRYEYFFAPLIDTKIFHGARVLDLGCNAGFWTLKALEAGASQVIAVDAREQHLQQLRLVLEQNQIEPDRCLLQQGNVFDLDFSTFGSVDIVLCLGLLYHTAKPFELLERIASLRPKLVLIDTKISRSQQAILEVLPEPLDDPRMAADWGVVTVPSASALTKMCQTLGFQVQALSPHFSDWTGAIDYRDGDRLAFWCWQESSSVKGGGLVAASDSSALPQASSAMEPLFFTICARNYLGQTLSFAESLRNIYPTGTLVVFLLDEMEELPTVDGILWQQASSVVGPALWVELSLRYSILELATALKPYCFQQLFGNGAQQVVYCDPDLIFYDRPTEVEELLASGASGVILPHILTPLPRDGEQADDLTILKSGVFNLGFLALSATAESEKLLDWWAGWLRTECWADPKTGVFTDQKWMDFVPCLWPGVRTLYHPGYDVAYWNLHERRLDEVAGQWRVNDLPLVFFHFSGFSPSAPSRLSKHETRFDRIPSGSKLDQLVQDYRDRLLRHGYKDFSRFPLPQLRFVNGIPFDSIARRCFQLATERGLDFVDSLGVGPGSFFQWMIDPELGSAHSRYVHGILALRGDVVAAYPDFEGEHFHALRSWIVQSGVSELGISPDLLVEIGILSRESGALCQQSAPIRVNYIGYLRAEMGMGQAARGYVKALQSVGVRTALMDISHLSVSRCNDDSLYTEPPESMPAAPANINIFHINADVLPSVIEYLSPQITQGRYNIGIWAWESSHFPEQWRDRFALLDEIWVGSQFMANAIAPWASCPVVVMPHVVEVPAPVPCPRQKWNLPPDAMIFLFLFDFNSVVERKNPFAVIEAFARAFRPEDKTLLLIKTLGAEAFPEKRADLQARIHNEQIRIIDEILDRKELTILFSCCDVFVSLHRLEGFGLGLAEAMSFGKPVIATAYGGNTDFMRAGNSILIPYTLQELRHDYGPYASGTFWADPDIDVAAREMRCLYENRAKAKAIGERAYSTIAQELSPANIGRRMRERLELLDSQGRIAAAQSLKAVTPLTGAPASRAKKRLRILRALMRDAGSHPRHYLRRGRAAISYAKKHGWSAFRRRLLEELRRRGQR